MTWVDIILLIILIGLLIQGTVAGLIRGIFDIAGIVFGYLLAINYCEGVAMPRFLSFLLIFVLGVMLVSLMGRIFSKLIHHTPLGVMDRAFGGLLGLLKGFIISFVFLIILLLVNRPKDIIYQSEIAPVILKLGVSVSQVLPGRWYQWIRNRVAKRELVESQMPFDLTI